MRNNLSKFIVLAALLLIAVVCTSATLPLRAIAGRSGAPRQQPTPPPPPEDRAILRGDQSVLGSNFTLRGNETVQGDIFVLGGNAELMPGSIVNGDVAVLGGNAILRGEVTGDVVVMGGNVQIDRGAVVRGSAHALGGNLSRDAGAVVNGGSGVVRVPQATRPRWPDFENLFDQLFGRLFEVLFNVIANTLLSLAAWAVFPTHLGRARDYVRQDWRSSGLLGILSFGTFLALASVIAVLIVIFAITLIGIPVALLLGLIVALATLAFAALAVAGWAVSAQLFGAWLQHGFGRIGWTVLQQVLVGGVTLAIASAVPMVGWLIGLAACCIGLGAIVSTRLGTRSTFPALRRASTAIVPAPGRAIVPVRENTQDEPGPSQG